MRWLAGAVVAGTLAWVLALVAGAVREVRAAASEPAADTPLRPGADPAGGPSGREEP